MSYHFKTYIAGVESATAHLSSVMGAHINALDKSLTKILGKKPVAAPKPSSALQRAAVPLSQSLLSGVISGITGVSTKTAETGLELISGSTPTAQSRSQALAQAASAINKAMKRNL